MKRITIILCLTCLASCSGGGGGSSDGGSGSEVSAGSGSVVGLSDWEGRMRSFGDTLCQKLRSREGSFDDRLNNTYYDAEWVFYQIADYTGDPKWNDCAQAAERVYRDEFVLANDGKVPGFWNFSHGLMQDYMRTGDETSKEAAILLARNGAFAADGTPLESTESADLSREVAYVIMAYLNAEDLGEGRRSRLTELVDQALGHFDQWFVSRSAPYVRPFMVALTSHALISYYEKVPDERIISALTTGLDWLWEHTWDPSAQAFRYTDRVVPSGGTEPAPDLNLLIAPAYGWLYRHTGEPRFLERGDQIFHGGVRAAFLDNGKQFNQNYRWSFEYLNGR